MKNQVLFSSKDKSKKSKCRMLQFLFGALRVKFSVSCKGGIICFTGKYVKNCSGFGDLAEEDTYCHITSVESRGK